MLPLHLRKRYKTNSYLKLATRVSRVLGKRRNVVDTYFSHIGTKKFIPAGNTLLAGVDPILPNCCVLPSVHEANLDTIVKKATNLWSKRVGIGFDLSKARDPVRVLGVLAKANADIKLDHRPQRGNMATLNVNHPRVRDFIRIKTTQPIYNFNLSLTLTDTDFDLERNDFSNPKVIRRAAKNAHQTGDPGIIFLSRIQQQVPYEINDDNRDILQPIETVVPCGEQGMHPYETCTLGSINLAHPDFWKHGRIVTSELVDTIRVAVDVLDDALESIDYEFLDDPDVERVSRYAKRLGLGIMGWADALANLGIRYDDFSGVEHLIRYIGQLLRDTSHQRSREIAERDGYFFTDRGGRKHLSMTCIAPTGGITLLTGNHGFSIEPYFQEANQISWRHHLIVQSAWQSWIDNAISKTINLNHNASVDDVYQCYRNAYLTGCKSVTVYRNSSMTNQPISIDGPSKGTCSECS